MNNLFIQLVVYIVLKGDQTHTEGTSTGRASPNTGYTSTAPTQATLAQTQHRLH